MNPDKTMLPAGGKVVLHPKVTSDAATVTLGTPATDSGISLLVTQPNLSKGHDGSLTMTAGSTPGFYHYSVPSTDTSGVAQQQSGWILVGNPGATFTKTGHEQKAKTGSQISLSVTLNPGQSGGTVLFTTSAGMLSSEWSQPIRPAGPRVTLTLPSTAQAVHVMAEGQYALGHAQVTFTETAQ